MSEKLYTAAEVAQLLAAERAKSAKAVKFARKSGVGKTGKPYSGIQMSGDFYPVYLSESVAKALVENIDGLREALATPIPTAKAESPLTSSADTAPRLAPKA